jgi:hypothetical protein
MTWFWFIVKPDGELGPYNNSQMKQFAASGQLKSLDLVRADDQATPIAAGKIQAFFPAAQSAARPTTTAAPLPLERKQSQPPPPSVPLPQPTHPASGRPKTTAPPQPSERTQGGKPPSSGSLLQPTNSAFGGPKATPAPSPSERKHMETPQSAEPHPVRKRPTTTASPLPSERSKLAQEWYYAKGDQKQGPITSEQFRGLAMSGALKPTDLVWTEGMTDWIEASAVQSWISASKRVQPPLKATTPGKPSLPVTVDVDDAIAGFIESTPQQPWYCHWAFLSLTTLFCFPATLILVWSKSTYPKRAKWAWTGACGLMWLVLAASNASDKKGAGDKQANVADAPTVSSYQPLTTNSTKASTTQPANPKEKDVRGKLETFNEKLPREDGHAMSLLDVDHFIDEPTGAKELPDEVLTQEYYPFLKSEYPRQMYSKAVDMGPGVLMTLYELRHDPSLDSHTEKKA